MAQTTTIAPNLRALYRRYFGFLGLNKIVHNALSIVVNVIARAQQFYFPKKFNWEWKLEMLSKKYEKETVALCRKIIMPGMQVIDIGAHIGYFSRIFSQLVGNQGIVNCFEADPENFELLNKNTKSLSNVRLFKNAVADRDGTINFYHIEESTGCHSLIAPASDSRKITVDAVTLDSMLKNGTLEPADIIKMDIEGGEPLALRGMKKLLTNSQNIQLICEFNAESLATGGVSPQDFIALLESFGFTVYGITDAGPVPLKTLMDKNLNEYLLPTGYINLYCRKVSAQSSFSLKTEENMSA